MEIVVVLPAELLALAPPPPRLASPAPLGSVAEEGGADEHAAGFAQLLTLLAAAPAGGENLPQPGKELPAPAPTAVPEPVANDASLASVTPALNLFVTLPDPLAAIPAPKTDLLSAVITAPVTQPGAGEMTRAAQTSTGLPISELAGLPIGEPQDPATPLEGEPTADAQPARGLEPSAASAKRDQAAASAGVAVALAPLPASVSSLLPSAEGKPATRARTAIRVSDALDRIAAFAEPQGDASSGTRRTSAALSALLAPSAAQISPQQHVGAEAAASAAPALASDLTPVPSQALSSAAGHALAPTPPSSTGAPLDGLTAALGQAGSQPLDTAAPRWHEALAGRIHWLIDHDAGEARIKLNPPELGALDVKISVFDDKTYVQLAASSPLARDELAQSLPRLRELLSLSGLDLAGATVSDGRHDQPAYHAATDTAPSARELGVPAMELEAQPRHERLKTTRIDLFA